ncbi:hypothetical protein Q9L58_001934 [Maublancomyces gigas]|uniref:Uncharacterized protein n=1 Tax=Discina gigas TaxID=1032678 RepID=A0ABR3GT07_9PEZI
MAVMALVMPEKIVSKAWDGWKQARELHRALIYESWVKKSDHEKAMREEQERTPSDWQADVQVEQRKWWERVQDKLDEQLKAMGLWIDDDAFPKEVAFFVIMKGFVWSKDGEDVPVTASEFFHAFKEGKIAPIKRKPGPTTGADRKNNKTVMTTRTGAIGAKPSPVAGPDGKHGMIYKITGFTTIPVAGKDVIGIKINDVLDKGKSSVLSKLIICGQVGWMVLQLIGRQVLRLPMTLIELHTLIHIGIAVIRFWLWWYKPLDVGEPIVLDMEFTKQEDREWSVRPERFKSQGIGCFIDYLWLLPAVETCDSPAESGTPSANVDSTLESTININAINSGTPPDGGAVTGTAEEKKQVPRNQTDPQPVAQHSLWGSRGGLKGIQVWVG